MICLKKCPFKNIVSISLMLCLMSLKIQAQQLPCNGKPHLPSSSSAFPSGSSGGNNQQPSCTPPEGDQGQGGNDNDFGFQIIGIGSWDPNLIITPIGYDSARWVSINDNMGVCIYFENDPLLATAPVHNAYVYYKFGPKQDATTFKLGSFGFNGMVFTVPPNLNYYSVRLDLTDSLGLFVDFTAGINVVTNTAFFIFQSIDPLTNLPPLDPMIGFLPVRDSSITAANDTVALPGQGFVTFTAKPAASDITRDTIFAQAEIVFDINDTISTNIEFNTVDAVTPQSDVTYNIISPLELELLITGADDTLGSGIKNFDLYVAEDSSSYILYRSMFTDSTLLFNCAPGKCYHFFTLATDNTGNREAFKNNRDTTYCPANLSIAPQFTFNGNQTNNIALNTCNSIPQNICFTVTDPDGDLDSVSIITSPINGVASINLSNDTVCINYSANVGYIGNDSLFISACDTLFNCSILQISIVVSGVAPVSNVTVSGTTTFCEGNSVQLIGDSGAIANVQWLNNGNEIIGANNFLLTATNTGNYQLVLSNGCGNDTSLVIPVIVHPLPNVLFTGFSSDTLCINGTTNDTLISIPSGGTFTGNGLSGNIFIPANAGLGTSIISYSYTDSLGCSNTFIDSIVVDSCTSVGIDHSTVQNYFSVFPNPTEELINLYGQGVANGRYTIQLINTLGQVIYKESILISGGNLAYQMSLKGYTQGVYFISIQTDTSKNIIKVEKL